MLSKKLQAEIRSLRRAGLRKEKMLFVTEGIKPVTELLHSPYAVEFVVVLKGYNGPAVPASSAFPVFEVSASELNSVSSLSAPNQVLAVARIPHPNPVEWSAITRPVLMVDNLNDPGNMGTLLRSAEWFGVHHIICSNNSVDVYNPKVVQSAMGSLFRLSVKYSDLIAEIGNARSGDHRFSFIGATLDGTAYRDYKPDGIPVIVIGSESHGISEGVLSQLDVKLTIPRAPFSNAESLNAAIAGSLFMERFCGPDQ